jgi:hypothetical protein
MMLPFAGLFGGATENAALVATIGPGPLEIVPPSVAGPFSPTGGEVTVTDSEQVDALVFEINGISVNDLNGDGLGWRITAAPGNLTSGAETIPVGTVTGFRNPSDPDHTTVVDPTTGMFTLGTGVAGATIDFALAYTVPAFATAGTYSGAIVFSVIAE